MDKTLRLIREKVEEKLGSSVNKRFAVFDFDNTVIINDINEAVLAYMARNNLFRDKNLLDEMPMRKNYAEDVFKEYYGLLDKGMIREAYQLGARIISGYRKEEIDQLVRQTIEFEGQDIKKEELCGLEIAKGLKLRRQTMELASLIKDFGIEIWIVSASAEPLVQSAMKYFHIPGNLIGVRTKIINGAFSAEIIEPTPIMDGKVLCIQKEINPSARSIIGVGDSMNDLPMIEYSDIKVVVNRNNKLSDIATHSNWFLLDSS